VEHPSEWARTIVGVGTPEEMYQLETDILQMFDCKNDPRSFNKSNNEHPRGNTYGMKDKIHSQKTKQQMSESAKLYCSDPEVKKQRSESRKGPLNPAFGKPGTFLNKRHKEETKKILSDRRKLIVGWNHTTETKQKMSVWQTGVAKPRFICIHCGQDIGGQSNYAQHLKKKHEKDKP